MGAYGWGQNRPVNVALFEEGHLFGFHQALRLLEEMYRDRKPVGEEVHPDREVVRLRSAIRFDFPASEIEELRLPKDGKTPEMLVNVMTLAGELGPLPSWVAENALDRSHSGDATRAFLDLFNHRLLSLLHRARKKARPTLDPRSPEKGRVASTLFALLGLGTEHLRGAMGISERALLPFTGLLNARPRSAVGLERLLAGYFRVPVTMKQFQGRWEPIEETDLTRIGFTGQNQILGQSVVLGTRVFDVESAVELRIGPLTYKQFHDFLPRRTCARAIVSLVRFYAGEEIGFTYRLQLAAAEVPQLTLGRKPGAMLGWSTWLRTKPSASDDRQVHLQGRA